jgi:hypothetical protein
MAGNLCLKDISNIRVDTMPTPIYATVSDVGLSPNSDGYKDTIVFQLFVNIKGGVKQWDFTVKGNGFEPQMVVTGGDLPTFYEWDGTVMGRIVEDGEYTGVLRVEYEKGNVSIGETDVFRLDTEPPEGNVTIYPTSFSPNEDGVNDEVRITTDTKDLSPIQMWDMYILDAQGNVFNRFLGGDLPPKRIVWVGRSDLGQLVKAGDSYTLVFIAEDDLGNRIEQRRDISVEPLNQEEQE